MTEERISKQILQHNQEEISTDEEWKILKAQMKKRQHASLTKARSGEEEKGVGVWGCGEWEGDWYIKTIQNKILLRHVSVLTGSFPLVLTSSSYHNISVLMPCKVKIRRERETVSPLRLYVVCVTMWLALHTHACSQFSRKASQ